MRGAHEGFDAPPRKYRQYSCRKEAVERQVCCFVQDAIHAQSRCSCELRAFGGPDLRHFSVARRDDCYNRATATSQRSRLRERANEDFCHKHRLFGIFPAISRAAFVVNYWTPPIDAWSTSSSQNLSYTISVLRTRVSVAW